MDRRYQRVAKMTRKRTIRDAMDERVPSSRSMRNTDGVTVTEQALRLAPSERLDLIGTLWDSLLDEGVDPPISDEQRAEHQADPDAVMSWDEARRRLSRR